MSRPLPWEDIAVPSSDYNVRLVAGPRSVPVYWGRDREGRCLLIVELEGNHTAEFRRDVTSAHGIAIDLRDGEVPERQRLVLTLDRSADRDLFLGLCETLIASVAPLTDSAAAVSATLAHIRRWKAFLAGRQTRILKPEEVRGLFAELQFMRSLYEHRLSPRAAVSAWSGPDDGHQDFIFANTAIEVKSLAGRDRSTIRISSEDQLETVLDELFLVVCRLSELSSSAVSLNELVRMIERELGDADALEAFSGKLANFGYVPLRDYDEPLLVVSDRKAFRVRDGFPKLGRSELPRGIVRLSYEIEIEAMKGFEYDVNELLAGA